MKSIMMPYGENGITFTLFNELDSQKKLMRLLLNIDWKDEQLRAKLKSESIEHVYLFPCFGRRSGPGEPDVILITNNYNIFFELETDKIRKFKHFYAQIKYFVDMGKDLQKSSRKIVRKLEGYLWQVGKTKGKKTKGMFRNRKIFKDLLAKKREPLFVVITDDIVEHKEELFKKLENVGIDSNFFGFINYKKIKKMKGLSKTGEVINFNIKK
jgi:hypothetical protein